MHLPTPSNSFFNQYDNRSNLQLKYRQQWYFETEPDESYDMFRFFLENAKFNQNVLFSNYKDVPLQKS